MSQCPLLEITRITYRCLNVGNEEMIQSIIINDNPSNPQQPIHSLRFLRTSGLVQWGPRLRSIWRSPRRHALRELGRTITPNPGLQTGVDRGTNGTISWGKACTKLTFCSSIESNRAISSNPKWQPEVECRLRHMDFRFLS